MNGPPNKSPERISAMFDAIAKRYDLLNHVLSVGLDVRWRARAVRDAQLAPDARVLDAIGILDDACVQLCEGQYADIGFESRAAVTRAEYEATNFPQVYRTAEEFTAAFQRAMNEKGQHLIEAMLPSRL